MRIFKQDLDRDTDLGVMGSVDIDLDWTADGFVFVETVVFDKLEAFLEFGQLGIVDEDVDVFGFEAASIEVDGPAAQESKVADGVEIF